MRMYQAIFLYLKSLRYIQTCLKWKTVQITDTCSYLFLFLLTYYILFHFFICTVGAVIIDTQIVFVNENTSNISCKE
jgi:hypothetical protein